MTVPLARKSLPELVLSELRRNILQGRWPSVLPSERKLGEMFQVSRPTVRLALEQLKREEILTVKGKRTVVINRGPQLSGRNVLAEQSVMLLTPMPVESFPSEVLLLYGELGRQLGKMGTTIDIHATKRVYNRKVESWLPMLVKEDRATAWILYRCSAAVQRHFKTDNIPAIIFGNAHTGIDLPALQVAHHASLSHAIGSLRRVGHPISRIALIAPESDLAGNLEVTKAFQEAGGIHMILHEEQGGDLYRKTASLFRLVHPPSALISLRSETAARLHGWLPAKLNRRIPDDVSLISLEDAPFLSHLYPTITRYSVDSKTLVKIASRTLRNCLRGDIQSTRAEHKLISKCLPGRSVAPC